MLFCKRMNCPAGEVKVFEMPLSCLKWKITNFTDGDIYAAPGKYDAQNTMRIAAGAFDILVDRDAHTGTRKTCRTISIFAEKEGEVQVMYV